MRLSILANTLRAGRYVCTNPRDRTVPLKYEALAAALRRAVKGLGLTKQTCLHTLRHSAATRMLVELKMDYRTVMAVLGHKNMAMLQRYTHTYHEEMRRALETHYLKPAE